MMEMPSWRSPGVKKLMLNPDNNTLHQKSLATASLSALKWDYAGSAIRAVSSIAITVVLARILGPEPFGLVTAAWLVIGLANLVADLGLGSALLQRSTVSESDVRYAFTMQVCVGLGLMILVVLAGPLIAQIFNEAKVVPVVQAMSLIFVLQTFGAVALALLKRNMDFRSIQVARISSYLVGFIGLGIPLALFGFEVWSLIIAQLGQTALFSMISYNRVRYPVRPLFSSPSSDLNLFGLKVLSTNLVNYAISTPESFIIGRFFGMSVLGLYNRAYVLVSTPMNNVVASIQQVGFSAYSRKQDDIQTTRMGYIAGVGFMTILLVPLYGCMAVVPATVIRGLFGDTWASAIPFLTPLALSMPFHAVMAMGGPMLWANDRVGVEFVAQLFTAVVTAIVLFVASMISATAVAWGVLGVTIFRCLIITHVSLRTVAAPWSSVLRPTSASLILLVIAGGAVLLGDWSLQIVNVSALPRLVIDALLGGCAFLVMILSASKLVFSTEMHWVAERIGVQLPNWTRMLFERISGSSASSAWKGGV
jgi:lipopolysaccharide exporter